MKIINLLTNIIFDLPQIDAKTLLETSPDVFAKIGKNKKIIKNDNRNCSDNTVLSQILDK